MEPTPRATNVPTLNKINAEPYSALFTREESSQRTAITSVKTLEPKCLLFPIMTLMTLMRKVCGTTLSQANL